MTGTPLDTLLSQLAGPNLARIIRRSMTTDIFLKELHPFTTSSGESHGASCLMIHHRGGRVSAYLPFIRLDGSAADRHFLVSPSRPTPATLDRLRKHLRILGVLA